MDRSKPPQPARALWIAEDGEPVPAGRVKRIRFAQDVLNSAEESVYDTLWTSKTAREEKDSSRLVQAGYEALAKRTRLSKKTIQRIIDRLIAKEFLEIATAADIYLRTSTVYRVFSYRTVLERQARKNRFYAAKIGPGFVYVQPAQTAGPAPVSQPDLDLSTVDKLDPDLNLSTVVKLTTVTVDRLNMSTVVPLTTINIEQESKERTSSSSDTRTLRELIERQLGTVDDDAAKQLLDLCRNRAPDCTPEEIAYFVGHKLQWVRNIRNPVGFVLTAVPRHFENNGHLAVRELLRQEAEARRRQWRETFDYWSQVAADPAQDERGRAEARKVLETLEQTREN